MLNKAVLSLLVVTLALLASPGLPRPAAAQDWLIVDDSGPPSCAPALPSNIYTTISAALAAASNGDTIYVCDGNYTDSAMYIVGFNELTITGPGATPDPSDGVATINASYWVFSIQNSQQIIIEGLILDVQTTTSYPFDIRTSQGVFIQHNGIRSPTSPAVVAADSQVVQVLSNDIHDSSEGVKLGTSGHACDNCTVSGNTINVAGPWAINVEGNNAIITSNVVSGGSVGGGWGNPVSVAENQITGPVSAAYPLLHVGAEGGNSVGVTNNTLSDTTEVGLEVGVGPSGGSVTIRGNTFTRVAGPIFLNSSWAPYPLDAVIGGSASEKNTFVDSGGNLGDQNYLLHLIGVPTDINAEHNDWGLCTAAEIEQEIRHQVDDPALGIVDFDPFIAPASCSATPTPTPTATPTPTPTATPGPTATPVPGDTRAVTIPAGSWANFAWTGDSTPQTVADCFGAGNIAVMYRLDAATQTFQRWIRGREELSNMSDVLSFDVLLALNAGAQPATCTMPQGLLGSVATILPAGGWANFAWQGNIGLPADAVAEACGIGNIAVMYRLDAVTQTFQRWVRGRPDLSNMTDVQPYDALLALNGSDQPATCTFPVIVG